MKPNRKFGPLMGVGALVLAGSALAQDRPDSLLPDSFDQPVEQPEARPEPVSAPEPRPTATRDPLAPRGADELNEPIGDVSNDDMSDDDDEATAETSRRRVGPIGSGSRSQVTFDAEAWGATRGLYLQNMMRALDLPFPSRWGHIGLRNALLARASTPVGIGDVDWAAERAWLLVRMGEADAARLLIGRVAREDYTPKMAQVALQVALVNADPGLACPVAADLDEVEADAARLMEPICEALIGQPELATEGIRRARRRDNIAAIDVALADKLVGAAAGAGRAATIEWPDGAAASSWRFGVAAATGLPLPDAMRANMPPRMAAWQARAPMLAPSQRVDAARTATGMGVFSGQAFVDLHALLLEETGPDDLADSNTLRLRQAFVGDSLGARMDALRGIWASADDDDAFAVLATRALSAGAAARIRPSGDLEDDAGDIVAALLSVGNIEAASRWTAIAEDGNGDSANLAWAQLAIGLTEPAGLRIREARLRDTIDSIGEKRGALLVAALGGMGRIDAGLLDELGRSLDFNASRETVATRAIDAAATRGDAATVMLLAAMMMQTQQASDIPPRYVYHIVRALRRVDQQFLAGMMAAELVARP